MSTSLLQRVRSAGIAPRKSLGQHFLADDSHLARIADAAELTKNDTVLEIGPGPGVLTQHLAAQAGRVVAVETDARFVDFLRHEFAEQPHVEIVHADILNVDLCSLLAPPELSQALSYKVVANLPYYITSPILRLLLETACPPELLVLTIQREVALRVAASPPDMSLLAVSAQLYATPEVVGKIPAGAFFPPPQVDSAILRLRRRPRLAVALEPSEIAPFFDVVRAGFGQKRKQLHNSLVAGLRKSAGEIADALAFARVDAKRRAETLSLDEWAAVFRALRAAEKS